MADDKSGSSCVSLFVMALKLVMHFVKYVFVSYYYLRVNLSVIYSDVYSGDSWIYSSFW